MILNSARKKEIYNDFRRYFLVEISSLLCMCIEAIKRKSQNQKCDVVKCSFCKSLICKLHILLHSRTFLKKTTSFQVKLSDKKRLFTFAWRLYKAF